MDLKSKLRAIVQPPRRSASEGGGLRELTYEPDTGGYEAGPSIDRVCEQLGARTSRNAFGQCLVIDRRYESDRWHGDVRIGECELDDLSHLRVAGPGSRTGSRPDGVHRSGNYWPQRRGWHGRVSRRLRLLRSWRLSGTAVPADESLGRTRAVDRRRRVLRRCRFDRDLQRQDVRRAGDGDTLAVPSHGDAARWRSAFRCAAHGAALVEGSR